MRIFLVDILTFHGFFGVKFDILKPRWLPTAAPTPERSDHGVAIATSRWIRPLADYDRRETTEIHGSRYG